MIIGKIFVMALALAILFSSAAFADGIEREQPTMGMKIFDLLLVRPLSIVGSALSTGFYLVTVPITYPSGVSEQAARLLVEAPWRYTGMRYLGDFHHYKDGHPITVVPEE
ncbi:MAG: hypothetical protein ACXWMC_05585 [Syntrophales bacterium]